MGPGAYRQWNGGGACWLDPGPDAGDDGSSGSDPGSFAALQQVSRTFAACAANKNGASCAPGSCTGGDIDNNSVHGSGSLLQSGNYGAVLANRMVVQISSLYSAANAAKNDRKTQKCTGSGKEKYSAPGSVETNAANVQKLPENAAKKHPLRSIRAKDYKKLDIPGTRDHLFYLREEGCVVRGEIHEGTAGPGERPAGRPAAVPVVLRSGGKGGAGCCGSAAGDGGSFRDGAGNSGSREMSGMRGGKSGVDR